MSGLNVEKNGQVYLTGKNGRKCRISLRRLEQIKTCVGLINDSGLPYDRIILYGSCARGEAKYNSDIDIFVDMPRADMERAGDELMKLKNAVLCLSGPEVDIRFGTLEETPRGLYHGFIAKEGIVLCQK